MAKHRVEDSCLLRFLFLPLAASIGASGCLSFSSTDTARTTADGRGRFNIGANAGMGVYSEFGFRYGLTPSLDVGFETVDVGSGNTRLNLKKNIFNSQSFAFAMALEGSYFHAKTNNGFYSESLDFYDALVPFYNTFYLGDYFGVNLVPRVGYRFSKFKSSRNKTAPVQNSPNLGVDEHTYLEDVKIQSHGLFYGASAGVLIGKGMGVALEVGYYNRLPFSQISLNFFAGEDSKPEETAVRSPRSKNTKPAQQKR